MLKCEHCLQPYEAYYEPRMFPCCGTTICNTCIQLTLKQAKDKNYKCIVCNEVDTVPKSGFKVNRTTAKLLEKQPKEISRGAEVDKLKKNFRDLETLVSKLEFEMDNGEYLIKEDCKELRTQVQLVKEEKIDEINKHCDALFLKIDSYEDRCKNKFKEMNESKQKANELIKLVNDSIQQQKEHLRKLKIDEKKTMECKQHMNELKTKMEKERKNIKKSMCDNQIMKFKSNKTTIGEKFLGRLCECEIDFSVIFFIFIWLALFKFTTDFVHFGLERNHKS